MTQPLPEPQAMGSWGFTKPTSYTVEQLQEYGKACRAAALEEAAAICDGEQYFNDAKPVRYIAAHNDGCITCGDAIRSME